MQSRSVFASPAPPPSHETAGRNRCHYRHPISSLAYVRLDHANGGIIRNLSESGVAVQAVGRLHAAQVVHVRFELLKPKSRIDATGEVVWADASGQAGLRFVDLPARAQRQLRDWIFSDLLAAAAEFGPNRSPIFTGTLESECADGLLVSAVPVPSIQLTPERNRCTPDTADSGYVQPAEMPLRLSWWPIDIYPRTLAHFVDGLVVVSAVLLFAVIAIETVGIFPSWTTALALGCFLAVVFGGIYYLFFRYLVGVTLGRYLARVAAEDMHWMQTSEDNTPRFR